MKKIIASLLLVVLFVYSFGSPDVELQSVLLSLNTATNFEEYCKQVFVDIVDFSPDEMDYLGDLTRFGAKKYQDHLRTLTVEAEDRYLSLIRAALEKLDDFAFEKGTQEYYLKETLYRFFTNELTEYDFRYNLAVLSPIIGCQIEMRSVFLESHPFRNLQDAEDYLQRLKQVPLKAEQIVQRFNDSINRGILMNSQSIGSSLWMMGELTQAGSLSEIYKRFSEGIATCGDISEATKNRLLKELSDVLQKEAIPGFKKITNALSKAQTKPNKNLGAYSQPNGEAWYRFALKFHTTMDWEPKKLYEWGVAEVEKLRSTIEEHKKSIKTQNTELTPLGGSLWDFLPEWFEKSFIPTFAPEIVPFYSDMYSSPNLEGTFKGIYYSTQTPPIENTIFFHEVVPGHHLERTSQLNRGLPLVAHLPFFTVFVEGWALYAESLVSERFPFPDRELDFLRWLLIRAKRVVADTGINAMGWSYDQTVNYMSADSSMPKQQAQNEVNRYLTWPGQACSYYIGYSKIVELREKAKASLGDRFDLRKFHTAVLEYGQLPVDLLQEKIDSFISTESVVK